MGEAEGEIAPRRAAKCFFRREKKHGGRRSDTYSSSFLPACWGESHSADAAGKRNLAAWGNFSAILKGKAGS